MRAVRVFDCYRACMRVPRQRAIVARVTSAGTATTEELAALCDVSLATVRRDLIELEAQGAIRRVHGGAVAHDGPDADTARGFSEVAAHDTADKRAVAARAAALVGDGECVILDIGTTTMMLARELRGRPVTVVTASLAVLDVLRDDPTVELVLLGGMVRRSYHSLVGALTEDALRQVRGSHVFLGASGVRSDGSVLDTTMVEVPVKRALLRAADRSVLLVDRHKFPGTGALRVCGPGEDDTIITNTGADPDTTAACREAGTEVLYA
jgi:DeoR/GlpR family transcriptional regulator of sugar metabolism